MTKRLDITGEKSDVFHHLIGVMVQELLFHSINDHTSNSQS